MYHEAGTLLLASRMKRLGDRLFSEITRAYKGLNLPFEPSWFPVFYLLDKEQPHSVSSIAREMGVTDSAVSQLIRQLKERDLIGIVASNEDKRAGSIYLSAAGKILLRQVKPVWQAIESTIEEALISGRHAPFLLYAMAELENSLDTSNLARQIKDKVEICRLQESCTISSDASRFSAWIDDLVLTFTIKPHPSWPRPVQIDPDCNGKSPGEIRHHLLLDDDRPLALLLSTFDPQSGQPERILFCASPCQPATAVEDFFLRQYCRKQAHPVVITVHQDDKGFLYRLQKIGCSLYHSQNQNNLDTIDMVYSPIHQPTSQEQQHG